MEQGSQFRQSARHPNTDTVVDHLTCVEREWVGTAVYSFPIMLTLPHSCVALMMLFHSLWLVTPPAQPPTVAEWYTQTNRNKKSSVF
jgi:hypothetical protein